jgi:hypothetical protein
VARPDLLKRGYSLKAVRMWPPSADTARAEPTPEEWTVIGQQCRRLQAEMLQWANCSPAGWDPRAVYDGTFDKLITIYLDDPDSPFRGLRFHTKPVYLSRLRTLRAAVGQARISALSFRDFRRWHEGFCKPTRPDAPRQTARGHALMTFVRIVIAFGALLRLSGCREAKETLEGMEFTMPKKRTVFMTAEQCIAHRQEAHRQDIPSMALADALMFELMARPKDIIGERVPLSEPGISEVTHHGKKWMHGLHWKEVSPDLILTHRLSKSLRGRNAVTDPNAGKIEHFDLKSYPMILDELQHVTDRTGPMVVCEATGRPWSAKHFAAVWRRVARACGIPDHVQLRDWRASGITEGRKSGNTLEDLRHHAGHSKITTTAGYDRVDLETKNKVAQLRVKTRSKTP